MHYRKQARAEAAQVSQAAWRKLSTLEQLKALESRPGDCAKQKARLNKKLEAELAAAAAEQKPAKKAKKP